MSVSPRTRESPILVPVFRNAPLRVPVAGLLAVLVLSGCQVGPPAHRYTGNRMDILCDASANGARRVLAAGESYIQQVSDLLRRPGPPKRLEVLLFRRTIRMRSYVALNCPARRENRAACFQTPTGYIVTLALDTGREQTLRNLRHELTHYVVACYYYDVPPWIDEGLAEFCETGEPFGQPNRRNLRLLRPEETQTGELYRLIELPAGAPLSEKQYAQAWSLVHYLIEEERYGIESILTYLQQAHSGPEAIQAFRTCFGVGPGELEPQWREHVRRLRERAL